MKQESVALFSVPDADVFALHLLLRFGQSLLQTRHGPEIPADGEQPPVAPEPANSVADRDIRAVARGVIDLPPPRQPFRRGDAEHFFDLLAAVGGDSGNPAAADPVCADLLRQIASENAASRMTPSLSSTSATSAAAAISAPAPSASR